MAPTTNDNKPFGSEHHVRDPSNPERHLRDSSDPEPFVLEPQDEHQHTAIMLHGRGSTGEEFSTDLFESRFSSGETLRELLPGFRWVFPTASSRYSAVFKESLNQWYDIYSLTDPESQAGLQVNGIEDSVKDLKDLIAREAARSPTRSVILGGVSQGFTIALLAALNDTPNITCLFGFCSWLPFKSIIVESMNEEEVRQTFDGNLRQAVSATLSTITMSPVPRSTQDLYKTLPMYIAHCTDDDVVDVKLGRQMKDVLARLGHQVAWRETPTGGHWINEPQGMNGLKSFLWAQDLVKARLTFLKP